jgi:hypothetical protein
VKESLRQICIFQENNEKWWNYAGEFSKQCLKQANQEKCVGEIFGNLKIDQEKIDKCMRDSFLGPNESIDDNTLLQKDHELFTSNSIQSWPSVVINNVFYRVIQKRFLKDKETLKFF